MTDPRRAIIAIIIPAMKTFAVAGIFNVCTSPPIASWTSPPPRRNSPGS
jgi:hypothetical protein